MSGLLPKGQVELRKVHPLPTDSGLGTSPDDQPGGPPQKRLTQWTIIAEKTGVQVTKERLKSYWTTLGVVSALMAALTYPAVITPAITRHNTTSGPGTVDDVLFITYVLLNTLSLILSFMVVIISVVLLAEVDLVVTDDDLEVFINRYQYLFLVLTAIFGFSILVIIGSIIVGAFFNYTRGTAIASACICVAGTVFVAVVAAWVATWTRARLKVHISEARAVMKAALARFRKGLAGVSSNPQGQAQGQGQPQGVFMAAVAAAATAAGGSAASSYERDESTRRKPSL